MKTIKVFYGKVLLATVTRGTYEEAEHIGRQYATVFGGDKLRLEWMVR